ncbi:MAG: nuclease-related domain-containing protein [Rhodospirillales bacterium]|nr:nuclease-related domain-containing protein [Rhodospirillales bacterium]
MRPEQTIFDELAALCISEGFIHAISIICFRDTAVGFAGNLSVDDLSEARSQSRLIRTEITTLIGLTMRSPIDFSLPEAEVLSAYIEQAEALLEELHQSMLPAPPPYPHSNGSGSASTSQFDFAAFLREAIFYSGESAYPFQYRDLAIRKYKSDSDWLWKHKSIRLETGRSVCRGVGDLLNRRLYEVLVSLRDKPKNEWTMLPGFTFSCEELAGYIDKPADEVRAFVKAFTLPQDERNDTFTSLHAFNAAYAYPFVQSDADKFILLQYYGVSQAFYETPFYWMYDDQSYKSSASSHRGDFTEVFAAERLKAVFGHDKVFRNVNISISKGEVLGDIDVLVVFGDRIIVVQAKSKRLTLEARKGNDRALEDDFKKAIQDAVDQSYRCSDLLNDTRVQLRLKNGRLLDLSQPPRTVFPVTVVADHYPALSFQALHFLKAKSTDQILPPLVTDVFALDAMTEMLASPLRLLSYLGFRARHGQKILASHEHMILSYHLKQNLWFERGVDHVLIEDDVSSDLDLAMAVRREGVPGRATPDGILTRFEGTHFAKVLSEIDGRAEPVAINLGFMLLELGEDTVKTINGHIEEVLARSTRDGQFHNMVVGISEASTGLTVHCSRDAHFRVESRLREHCAIRKYTQKANSWFGLALNPEGSIRLVAQLVGDWKADPEMERRVQSWARP